MICFFSMTYSVWTGSKDFRSTGSKDFRSNWKSRTHLRKSISGFHQYIVYAVGGMRSRDYGTFIDHQAGPQRP